MPREPIPIEPTADPAPEPGAPITWTVNGNGTGDESSVFDLAIVESMLDQLANEQNVYEYIDRIQHVYHVPPQYRQRFYESFISLVAMRDQAEQDALIAAGQPVFRYRVETARNDVLALPQTSGTATKIAPTVVGDDFIADIIHVPTETPSVKYLRYAFETGETEVCDDITLGNITYKPPQSAAVGHIKDRSKDRGVLLPTEASEYGDTWSLACAMRSFVTRWVSCPDAISPLFAVAYAFMTWVIERFDAVPYFRALGDWGSGKTRLITVVGALCHHPTFLAGATSPASIFRLADDWRGTLVIDEGDFKNKDEVGQLLEKILLIGYKRGFSISRVEEVGGKRDVVLFDPFGCKLTSNRRGYEAALDSRCMNVVMPALNDVDAAAQLPPEFWLRALELRNQLQLWRYRTLNQITVDVNEKIPNVIPRVREVGLSLLAVVRSITGQLGSPWERQLIARFQEMSDKAKADRAESWEGLVAEALVNLARTNGPRVVTSSIRRQIQAEHRAVDLSQRKVNQVLRDALKVHVVKSDGQQWVVPTPAQIARLISTYSIALPQQVPSAESYRDGSAEAVTRE